MRPFNPTAGARSIASRLASASTPADARMVKTGFDPAAYRLKLHLKFLVSSGRLAAAREVLDQMPQEHTLYLDFLNRILKAHSRSRDLAAVDSLFHSAYRRDATTWTIMMGALSADGRGSDALSLFRDMIRAGVAPDHVSATTVLNVPGCDVASLHPVVTKLGLSTEVVVCNTLLDAYSKEGFISAARRVFLEMPRRDTITYNAMIMGCSREGLHTEALELFAAMRWEGVATSQFTFSSLLTVATAV